jgi:hypothetical protein
MHQQQHHGHAGIYKHAVPTPTISSTQMLNSMQPFAANKSNAINLMPFPYQ